MTLEGNSQTMNNGRVMAEWDLDEDWEKAEFSFSTLYLLELLGYLQQICIIWKQNPLFLANFLFWCNFNPVDKLQEWSRNPRLLLTQTHHSVYIWPIQCISQMRMHYLHLHTPKATFPDISPASRPAALSFLVESSDPRPVVLNPPWSPPTSLAFLLHAPSQVLLPASLKHSVFSEFSLGPLVGCVCFLFGRAHTLAQLKLWSVCR